MDPQWFLDPRDPEVSASKHEPTGHDGSHAWKSMLLSSGEWPKVQRDCAGGISWEGLRQLLRQHPRPPPNVVLLLVSVLYSRGATV